jgi:hypothetical protein
METNTLKQIENPPKLMNAIIAGFNLIANHIILILFPVVLDTFIWLGPRLRLQNVLEPMISRANQTLNTYNNTEITQLLESAQEAWSILISRINLTNSISTFPLGIPSLLSGTDLKGNPIGTSFSYEIPSFGLAVVVFILLTGIGVLIGGFYFSAIAKTVSTAKEKISLPVIGSQLLSTFALLFLIIGLLIIVVIPALMIVSVFALFSPAIAQIVLLIFSFIFIWLLIPLVFTPHGIFLNQLNVVKSIVTSFRLIRLLLPGTGLFLLLAMLIAQGLDILWHSAPSSSWFTLIGIIGHAFIYTSLITASFIYYQQGLDWMDKNIQRLTQGLSKTII